MLLPIREGTCRTACQQGLEDCLGRDRVAAIDGAPIGDLQRRASGS